MQSDIPLKEAYRIRPKDLLPLTGDARARIVSAQSIPLPQSRQEVDFVLHLRRDGEEYLRHIEFQTRHRGHFALRFFGYASALAVRSGLPVLTTVMYVRPPAPHELTYRSVVGGSLMNHWGFGVVRLWELSPERLLALGPGGAALVPLSREASLPLVAAASRRIQRDAPPARLSDLLAILQVFAEGRYTARQLARVIPEEVAMASGLFEKVAARVRAEGRAEGRAAGRAEGRVEGRAEEARRICMQLAKTLHPAVASRVIPVIEACAEPTRLRHWTLRASRLSDAEFARLVTRRGASHLTRRRVPRPARKIARGTSR
jgi:predicted transposase YdaD